MMLNMSLVQHIAPLRVLTLKIVEKTTRVIRTYMPYIYPLHAEAELI